MSKTLAVRSRRSVARRVLERARANTSINQLEAALGEMPQVDLPLVHRFTPGLYSREVRIPAGTLLTSKIHKTEHPFVISRGVISVWTEGEGTTRLSAPHTGITKPGTRRVLFAHTEVIWTTFHPTKKTDVAAIEKDIIFPHQIPIQTGGSKCLG